MLQSKSKETEDEGYKEKILENDARNPAVEEKAIVKLKGIRKQYNTGVLAIDHVTLDIQEGEFVSIVGPSGCGKSTLLRIIAGLGDYSAGSLEIASGETKGKGNKDTGLSYVFQDATLMPWRTVLDNVTLPLALRKVPKAEREAAAMEKLKMVGLEKYADAYPRQLSGGMKMRVSIARALASGPKLLLMDEPFGALDEMTRYRLNSELLQIWQDTGITVVFVTHNVQEAVFLSTKVVAMRAHPGRIREVVPIDRPYPRGDEFRSSLAFTELSATISSLL